MDYKSLNARQKEKYSFQCLGAILARFGFDCVWLTSDYDGADFLAIHNHTGEVMKVQLKSGWEFRKRYVKQNLWITFPDQHRNWFLYDHNDALKSMKRHFAHTKSWKDHGRYASSTLTEPYRKRFRSWYLGKISVATNLDWPPDGN